MTIAPLRTHLAPLTALRPGAVAPAPATPAEQLAPTAPVGRTNESTPATAGARQGAAALLVPATQSPRLTTAAVGALQSDADQVERALALLRATPSGAQLVDALVGAGARVDVRSDQDFALLGLGAAYAFYDPTTSSISLRRSSLADSQLPFAAVALAHEGTHLVDDRARVNAGFLDDASRMVAALGGAATRAGIAAQEQASFELTMVHEARAFTFAGQVARELGVRLPLGDPTTIAAAGGNDPATYARVWDALLASSYNPERRIASPRSF